MVTGAHNILPRASFTSPRFSSATVQAHFCTQEVPMSEHHDHAAHSHGHKGHGSHGPGLHAPSGDAPAAYKRASETAQPDANREVVRIDVEAREAGWEF